MTKSLIKAAVRREFQVATHSHSQLVVDGSRVLQLKDISCSHPLLTKAIVVDQSAREIKCQQENKLLECLFFRSLRSVFLHKEPIAIPLLAPEQDVFLY